MSNNSEGEKSKLAKNIETTSAVIGATAGAATALVTLFTALAQTRDALKGLSMPNIPLRTNGGKVFWNELANVNGWRLQKNTVWGTCRIIDPDNIRRAWGGEEAMLKALKERKTLKELEERKE